MINARIINRSNFTLEEREKHYDTATEELQEPHVLLATCNRTELYWGKGDVPRPTVEHLFRVAAGLESALIGERAIQGQLKQAYYQAKAEQNLSGGLNRLFQTAIHTGKRVRSETRISAGAVSHSQVAVEILKDKGIDLREKTITLVGVNKLNEDIMKFLTARGAEKLLVSNRHVEKAERLAAEFGGTALPLSDKKGLLSVTDVLITATSAPHAIFSAADMPRNHPLLVIDLAFPRDVEAEADQLPNVEIYNLDTVEKFAQSNIRLRQKEVAKAEAIIADEITKFEKWQEGRKYKELRS